MLTLYESSITFPSTCYHTSPPRLFLGLRYPFFLTLSVSLRNLRGRLTCSKANSALNNCKLNLQGNVEESVGRRAGTKYISSPRQNKLAKVITGRSAMPCLFYMGFRKSGGEKKISICSVLVKCVHVWYDRACHGSWLTRHVTALFEACCNSVCQDNSGS